MVENNLLSLSYGHVKRRDINSNEGLLPASYETYNIIEPNDIVLRFTDLQNDQKSLRVGLANERGIITSAYTTIRPYDACDSRFLYYALHAFDLRKGFYGMGAGVRQGLKWQEAKYIQLPWPNKAGRTHIADYLDAKCAEIDAAEEAAEASIGDYLSMRHALISNAVTHGVDGSNRARKDLGVPYVDGVPVSWSKAKLVWLLSAFIDCPHETPDYSANGPFLVIRAGDQTEGGLVQDNMLRLDSGEYERRTRRSKLLANDIVYGREGNWGKASIISETDKYCLGQRMMQFRCNESKLEPRFATYALNAEYVREQGRKDEVGSTSRHVNVGTIANYWLAVPPIDEQLLIADYLDSKCAAVDCAIAQKQSIIDDLKAYKQSLIYEVVTGKKEV